MTSSGRGSGRARAHGRGRVGTGVSVAVVIACLTMLLSTSPAGAAGTGSISGTVTKLGGGSVSGFVVRIADAFLGMRTTTLGADGTYSFSGLEAGDLYMSVEPHAGDPLWLPFVETIDIQSGPVVKDVQMLRGAGVRGTVTTSDGQPVAPYVQLLDPNTAEPVAYSQPTGSAGGYQLVGPAGTYVVAAGAGSYATEYSGGVTEFEDAETVTITAGNWRSNYDLVLEPLPPTINTLTPSRLVDTRIGKPQGAISVTKSKVVPATPRTIKVTGVAGVPSSGVTAVSLNVTAVAPTGDGYVTVYPCGARPTVSSLNFTKGAVVPNSVVAPVSASGTVCFFSSAPSDLLVDISGWMSDEGGFSSLPPKRMVDTRTGVAQGAVSVTKQKVRPGATLAVDLKGAGGVPSTSISAVSLNVTATGSASGGYVSVFPCFDSISSTTSSTLNFSAKQTVANATIVATTNEKVCVSSNVAVDLILDVNGYFRTSSSLDTSFSGFRLADTRPGKQPTGGTKTKIKPGTELNVFATLNAGKPVALNVSVTGATQDGYLTVYPCGPNRPSTSNLNFSKGQTVANMVITPTSGSNVCVYSSAPTDVIVDLVAMFRN